MEPQNVQHLMNIINYKIHIHINKLCKTYTYKYINETIICEIIVEMGILIIVLFISCGAWQQYGD